MDCEKLRYSVKHAQDSLDIGNTKFWGLVRTGKISVHYDGGRAYVTCTELQRYVKACESGDPADQANSTKIGATAH